MKRIKILQADVTELLCEATIQPEFKAEVENLTDMLWPDDVYADDGVLESFVFSYPEKSDTYIVIDVEVEIKAKAVTIGDGYRSRTTYENYIAGLDVNCVELYIDDYEETPSTWDSKIIEIQLKQYEG